MPLARVGPASPQDMFNDMPPVSKGLLVAVLLTTVGCALGLISEMDIALIWPWVTQRFHVWRLVSNFFYMGRFSFGFLINFYLLVSNALRYEACAYNTGAGGTSADFAWMLVFGMAVMCGFSYLFPLPFMARAIKFMIIYVWSRREPETQTSIFFFKFAAIYLPWILVAFSLLTGDNPTLPLLGVGVGHLYYFLVEVVPGKYNYTVIQTPAMFIDFFARISGQYAPPAGYQGGFAGAGGAGAGHAWGGGGRPLGR